MVNGQAGVSVNETLASLLTASEAASARMSVQNPNRALLLRLCAYAVALTQRVAALEAEREKSRVVLA